MAGLLVGSLSALQTSNALELRTLLNTLLGRNSHRVLILLFTFILEAGPHVAQAGCELLILLPPFPKF